jgi:hypothetical protein
MANDIGWGEGACNNDIGWGIAQEYFSCSGSGEAPVGATLMKTGQTTSYRTGDDGDIEAGRATSFSVLSANNPFGNTNRFTDTLGGTAYANNIVLDWSTYNGTTVLGWYRIPQPTVGAYTWNQAIDNALTFSIGTYTSGWRLANLMEYSSLFNFGNSPANKLNYSPFNITADLWSSNTHANATTYAFYIVNSSNDYYYFLLKTTAIKALFERTFTVSGTTLS